MQDIRPPLGEILDAYERLSYKAKSAISEFVDNSTGSYFLNKVFLRKLEQQFSLKINILYDPLKKTLSIMDNAMGMNKEELYNALRIAKRPSDINGRNEFGKTAAKCHFATMNCFLGLGRFDLALDIVNALDDYSDTYFLIDGQKKTFKEIALRAIDVFRSNT